MTKREEINGGITADQVFSRRFDESTRTRNRGDAQIQYSPTDRLSFSGFGGTMQDNFNHRGGVNSATPLELHCGHYVSLLPVWSTERSFLQRRLR